MFFLNPHKLYSQLRDGTNCGKAVILPLPAETCNRREFQIREKEMWFEFHGSGTEVSLKLSPGAQNPVNELTEAILFRERGGCPDLEEIKKEHIGRLENERRINFERLEHGVNYKLKLVREVRIPENFEMCLMMEKMYIGVSLCNSIDNKCYSYDYYENICYDETGYNSTPGDCFMPSVCVGTTVTFDLAGDYNYPTFTSTWEIYRDFSDMGCFRYVHDYGLKPDASYSYTFDCPGTYQISASIYIFCAFCTYGIGDFVTSTGNILINVIDNDLNLTITPENPVICEGESVTLNATASESTFEWSPSTGLNTTSEGRVIANPLTTTTYTVTATNNTTGCTASKSVTVTVINVTITSTKNLICEGGDVNLTASGASTYSWSPSADLSSETGSTVTASPSVTTIYTVVGTNSSTGCSVSATINITVIDASAPITINTSDNSICRGEITTLSASSGFDSYLWSPSLWLSSTTLATITAFPLATTSYTVTSTDSRGCTASASEIITVTEAPFTPIIVGSQNTCTGISAEYIYKVSSVQSGVSYNWIITDGNSVTTKQGPEITYTWSTLMGGTVEATASLTGCTITKSYSINVTDCPCDVGVHYCELISADGDIHITSRAIWRAGTGDFANNFPCSDHEDRVDEFYFDGNIIVEPGGQLAIYGIRIYFSPRAKIIVQAGNDQKKGGRLLLNGATLSAVGSDCMWNGTDVEGLIFMDNTNPDFNMFGKVELNNGAKIEHALIGINSKYGGIVIAKESNFYDNLIHVKFNPFSSITPSELVGNNFTATGLLRNGQRSVYFVFLNGVKGINIQENNFTNVTPAGGGSNSWIAPGTAIYSTDCKSLNINHCQFNNFSDGINHSQTIRAIAPTNNLIDNNNFNKNFNSIKIFNGNTDKISKNIFENPFVSCFWNECNGGIAVFLMNSEGFTVTENNISDYQNSIVSDNTNATTVYTSNVWKNTITGGATISAGGNNHKLQFYCNDLNNYTSGLLIYDLPNQNAFFGNQGLCRGFISNEKYPAGNYFRVTTSTMNDISVYTTRTGNIFEYVYDENTFATDPSVKPDPVSSKVRVTKCNTVVSTSAFCKSLPGILNKNENTLKSSLLLVTDTSEKADLQFELLELYLTENRFFEAEQLLIDINTPEAKKLLIPYYIEQKRFSDAKNLITQIPLDGKENEQFILYHSLLCELGEAGKSCFEMKKEQLQLVRNISKSKTSTSVSAYTVLGLLQEESFPITCDLLGNCPQNTRRTSSIGDKNDIINNYEILPINIQNPISDQLIISIDFHTTFSTGLISINDITGKKIKEYPINPDMKSMTITTQDLCEGLYVLVVQINGNLIYRNKLVVVR